MASPKFEVEFELALGIWLLSGLFKRLAWLVALACFGLFCCVTLYKALTGATSCGCFGTVHVNPWVTLTIIDLPAVLGLSLFRPRAVLTPFLSFLRGQESTGVIVRYTFGPLPPLPRLAVTITLGLCVLGLTAPILVLNKPPLVTSTYEVLEPETWVGRELPIIARIDIAEQLRQGTWLLLFYHHDCPHCQLALPQYEQMAQDLSGNEDFIRIGMIEVPPYGKKAVSGSSSSTLGKMDESKEWWSQLR